MHVILQGNTHISMIFFLAPKILWLADFVNTVTY